MLPQFGFSEFMLLAIAALIIVGPRDLPVMMRKLGQIVAKGRSAAREFQAAFDDIARQTELDELRKEIEDLKRSNMVTEAQAELSEFERAVNADVMREDTATPAATTPAKGPQSGPASGKSAPAASADTVADTGQTAAKGSPA